MSEDGGFGRWAIGILTARDEGVISLRRTSHPRTAVPQNRSPPLFSDDQ